MDGDQHGGGAAGGGVEKDGGGFDAGDLAAEDGVGRGRVGDDAIAGAGEELADDGLGETLLDAVASGLILKGDDGDGFDVWREASGAASDVIAAAGEESHRGTEAQSTKERKS